MPVQTYDIVMLVVLVGTMLFGAWKGMAWQLASLGSLVLSWVVATNLGASLAPYISQSEPWNRFLAMLILFLATSLVVWILFRFVAGVIDRVRLREFDRQMGALFGLAKGVLLCLVITFFAVTLSERIRGSVLDSRSGYYTAVLIQRATPMLPTEVREVLGRYIDRLDRELAGATAADHPATGEAQAQEQENETGQTLDRVLGAAKGVMSSEVLEAAEDLFKRTDSKPNELANRSLELANRSLETRSTSEGDRGGRTSSSQPLSPTMSSPLREPRSIVDESADYPLVSVAVGTSNETVYYIVRRISGRPDLVWEMPLNSTQETVGDAIRRVPQLPNLEDKEVWISRARAGGGQDGRVLTVDWNSRTRSVSPATNYRVVSGDRIIVADQSGNGDVWR